jgi:hypothetical protein
MKLAWQCIPPHPVEHEDPLASAREGCRNSIDFLQGLLLREMPGKMWWA